MRILVLLISTMLLSLSACANATSNITESYSNLNVMDKTANKEFRSYTGWVAMKRQIIDPSAAEDEWVSMRGIKVTDQGKKIKILDNGVETGYSLQLIVITYEKTNVTVLKLGVIEDAKDYTRAYAWAQPGADLLGINIRWVQTGFTLDK